MSSTNSNSNSNTCSSSSSSSSSSSTSSISSTSSTSSTRTWRDLSHDELAAIDRARQQVKAKGDIPRDPKGTYGAICRACTKPNNPDVSFCTGCSFPLSPYDVVRLPDNIFLQMINGEDVGANVLYRSSRYLIFDDKFPVSSNHICVIPTQVIEDITSLGKEHLAMLYDMYRLGLEELKKRDVPWLKGHKLEDFLSAGYNFPVSVKHLHIHMMIPPYKHEKILQYPRWHSHAKVVGDIEKHGRVILYKDEPDDVAGTAEVAHAMASWKRANELISSLQAN